MQFEVEEMAYSPPEIWSRCPGYQIKNGTDRYVLWVYIQLTQPSLKITIVKICYVAIAFQVGNRKHENFPTKPLSACCAALWLHAEY